MASSWAIDWQRPDYTAVWTSRGEALERIAAASDDEFASLMRHYSDKPAEWITDFGMTFDPRNPERGLPATAPFILFPKQVEAVNWIIDRWRKREDGLVEKSRDMGVSWICVAVAVWMWTFEPGVVVGFGSRKEDYVDRIGDPSSLFWKIRSFIGLLPPRMRPAGYDEKKHAPFMRVLNPSNGSAIIGEAGSNIGRGARTSVYFKDESAFYEQPEQIDAALSQTSNCKIDVSTPQGEETRSGRSASAASCRCSSSTGATTRARAPTGTPGSAMSWTPSCWPRRSTATTARRSATVSSPATLSLRR